MSTEFTLGVGYGVPPALVDGANDFLAWIGYSLGDRMTFVIQEKDDGSPVHEDAEGLAHAVVSARYRQEFFDRLTADLDTYPIPEWCYDETDTLIIDEAAARTAQASMEPVPEDLTDAELAELVETSTSTIFVRIQNLQRKARRRIILGPWKYENRRFRLRLSETGAAQIKINSGDWKSISRWAPTTEAGKRVKQRALALRRRYLAD